MSFHKHPPAALRLPCLSVKQPWAWLIACAGKDIENRTWRTNYRGPVLIHAGVSRSDMQRPDLAEPAAELTWRGGPGAGFGGIVGYAEIVDCVTTSQSKWFFGPFGFVLARAKPLPFVPCRGNLYFFEPPEGVLAALRGVVQSGP